MSYSSLWTMDNNYKGYEVIEFKNSWLFSPMVWGVLSDKYIRGLIETPYGYKRNLISDSNLFTPLNNKINDCQCTPDRICWEMSNQQVFFTKDKDIIAKSIRDFVSINSDFNKNIDGNYPLKQDHIIERFNEIANEILNINEEEYPYFIFKNTSVDDGIEYWFNKYDEDKDEYIQISLRKLDKFVTEFVSIENNKITGFTSNLDYFKCQ